MYGGVLYAVKNVLCVGEKNCTSMRASVADKCECLVFTVLQRRQENPSWNIRLRIEMVA